MHLRKATGLSKVPADLAQPFQVRPRPPHPPPPATASALGFPKGRCCLRGFKCDDPPRSPGSRSPALAHQGTVEAPEQRPTEQLSFPAGRALGSAAVGMADWSLPVAGWPPCWWGLSILCGLPCPPRPRSTHTRTVPSLDSTRVSGLGSSKCHYQMLFLLNFKMQLRCSCEQGGPDSNSRGE